MIRSNMQNRKLLKMMSNEIDIKINSFGLKIKRLENEVRSLRTKVKKLENKGE